jgi:hypothetical protein
VLPPFQPGWMELLAAKGYTRLREGGFKARKISDAAGAPAGCKDRRVEANDFGEREVPHQARRR